MAIVKTQPPLRPEGAGIREYVKQAFLYRWNMLLFLGGMVGAAMSPWPDALIPLVAAAEVTYLGGVIAFPRFRKAIDAKAYHAAREGPTPKPVNSASAAQDIISKLSAESFRRFEQVRTRCLEMRVIANEVRGRSGAGTAEDLNTPALDRLLWVFLRLLVSHEALNRFLERTDAAEIKTRLAEARAKLEGHTSGDERITRSLQDSVAANEQRLDNYERAQKNAEFVRVELDRIEAKIHALTESAVNRQDPDLLTSQIDSLSDNTETTEKAISELQQITGLVDELQEPPALLERNIGKVTG